MISAARSRTAAACGGAAGLGGPLDALDGQPHPGQVFQQPGGPRERPRGRGLVVHRGQSRRHGRARHAELGIARGEAVPAGRAVIPGARERDRPEHRVDHLVPVGDEFRLMALAARHPRAAVAGIGGQQLLQHAAAQLQHPGADHRLGCLQPGVRRSPATGPPPRPAGLSRRPSPARSRRRAPFFALRRRGRIRASGGPGLADLLVHLRDLLADRRELAHAGRPPAAPSPPPRQPAAGQRCRVPGRSGSTRTSARGQDDPGQRTRSSASRTCGSSRSPTRAGNHRPR